MIAGCKTLDLPGSRKAPSMVVEVGFERLGLPASGNPLVKNVLFSLKAYQFLRKRRIGKRF